MTEIERIVCDLQEAPRTNGRVLLVPWGTTKSKSGEFKVDDEAWGLIESAFREHGVDLPIDWDHQTLGGKNSAPDGRAPAAGWVRSLSAVPGEGIYGEVEWTPQGARDVHTKAYRYLSPVVLARQADRVVTRLHSLGLTNQPAIPNAVPLVNAEGAEPEAGTETPDAVGELLNYLRGRLELAEDATAGEILERLRNSEEEMANSARLAADIDQTKLEMVELRNKLTESEVNALLIANNGKVPPCDREWFVGFYRRDPERARQYLERAPKLISTAEDVRTQTQTRSYGRGAAIVAARESFRAAKSSGPIACSEKAWCNEQLEIAGQARMTPAELEQYTISSD